MWPPNLYGPASGFQVLGAAAASANTVRRAVEDQTAEMQSQTAEMQRHNAEMERLLMVGRDVPCPYCSQLIAEDAKICSECQGVLGFGSRAAIRSALRLEPALGLRDAATTDRLASRVKEIDQYVLRYQEAYDLFAEFYLVKRMWVEYWPLVALIEYLHMEAEQSMMELVALGIMRKKLLDPDALVSALYDPFPGHGPKELGDYRYHREISYYALVWARAVEYWEQRERLYFKAAEFHPNALGDLTWGYLLRGKHAENVEHGLAYLTYLKSRRSDLISGVSDSEADVEELKKWFDRELLNAQSNIGFSKYALGDQVGAFSDWQEAAAAGIDDALLALALLRDDLGSPSPLAFPDELADRMRQTWIKVQSTGEGFVVDFAAAALNRLPSPKAVEQEEAAPRQEKPKRGLFGRRGK